MTYDSHDEVLDRLWSSRKESGGRGSSSFVLESIEKRYDAVDGLFAEPVSESRVRAWGQGFVALGMRQGLFAVRHF